VTECGYSGIRKILDKEPRFFRFLLKSCSVENPEWCVVRVNLRVDLNSDFLEEVMNALGENSYDSFGKKTTLLKSLNLAEKKENKEALKKGQDKIHKDVLTVKKISCFHEQVPKTFIKSVSSICIGDSKKSTVTVLLSKNSKEKGRKKKELAFFKNRIEIQHYPKKGKQDPRPFMKGQKTKYLQKEAKWSTNYEPSIWFMALAGYDSDFARGCRSTLWLHSMLNSFTLSKSAKTKKVLSATYVESVVMPMVCLMSNQLTTENSLGFWLITAELTGKLLPYGKLYPPEQKVSRGEF
jgi:hypothetical protein